MDNVDNTSTSGSMGSGRPMTTTQRELDMLVELTKLRSEVVAMKEARELQAREYERRLDALNHENARVQSAQDTFLPREVYEATESANRKWRNEISTVITELTTASNADKAAAQQAREAQTRQFTQLIAGVGLFLTVLVFLLNYVLK